MSAPTPAIDIVSTVTFALTLALSPGAAAVVGPYAVIILCAFGGAAFSASSIDAGTKKAALWHLVFWTGVAVVFTVPASEILARFLGLEIRWLLAPVAGLIGAHPQWAWSRILSVFDRRAGIQAPEKADQ